MQTSAALKLSRNPTEYLNVFGVAFRYLRYLKVRQRIKATSTSQYGRLSNQELPKGELDKRAELERRQTFLKWLQDPDRVVYDDALSKAWKNYNEKKQAVHDERGRIAQLLFGEPKKNYEEARANLLVRGRHLPLQPLESGSVGNLRALKEYLAQPERTSVRSCKLGDIEDPRCCSTPSAHQALRSTPRESFSHEGRKLLSDTGDTGDKVGSVPAHSIDGRAESGDHRRPSLTGDGGKASLSANRALLASTFSGLIDRLRPRRPVVAFSDMTVLDVLVEDELRADFIRECENLLLFDSVYDQIIANLDGIAEEAQASQALSKESLARLVQTTMAFAASGVTLGGDDLAGESASVREAVLLEQMTDWYLRVQRMSKNTDFFRAVEEWKKSRFPHLSDALFVVVTHLFESLLLSYIAVRAGRQELPGPDRTEEHRPPQGLLEPAEHGLSRPADSERAAATSKTRSRRAISEFIDTLRHGTSKSTTRTC